MCAQFWTIKFSTLACPTCKKTSRWEDLQTHFLGGNEGLWCDDYYDEGQKIPALKGVFAVLDGKIDDFNGQCPKCQAYHRVGAEIKNGAVVKMWMLDKKNNEK